MAHKTSKLPPPSKLQVTSNNRDKLVLEYQEKREAGFYEDALSAFRQIAKFDETQQNYHAYIDILGHIRICYKLIADKCAEIENIKCAKKNYKEALKTTEQALKIAKTNNFSPNETAITNVHYASTATSLSQYLKPKAQATQLKKAETNSKLSKGYIKLAEAYLNGVLSLPEIRNTKEENDPFYTRRKQAQRIFEKSIEK